MKKYDSSAIKILEGLEAVRKRPAMYIGSTDKRGMHHLAWEIIDNGIDEVINGYGNLIKITINPNNSLTVEDNGRGIPVDKHESGKSTPEVIYTVLHAGGKFEEGAYKVSGGLHGVGASVVNALSTEMDVTIYKDKQEYNIKFKNGGEIASPLKKIGKTNKTGTKVTFLPDENMFHHQKFSFTTICERMQESAFLLDGLTIEVKDPADNLSEKFHYDDGLKSFVEYINENKEQLHNVLTFTGTKKDIEVNIAMQYTKNYNESILSFVNNVKTSDGGTHEMGFKTGLTKAFNEYAKTNSLIKAKDNGFDGTDVREGLSAIISLHIPEKYLQFEGQTKEKLGTPEAKSVVESIVYDNIKFFLEENKEIALTIIEKANTSRIAREAARKARAEARAGKNKKSVEKNMIGKLTPAQKKNPKINELFIVEGESAGGSAKQARDRKYQAILTLRGKILNTEKANVNEIYKNEEINTMIYAIGAGVGIDFNVKESNYDKVIIMTDADDDGAHIQVLLLTFFYRFMKGLIEEGHLYIALPPLYKISTSDKKSRYIWTNEEKDEFLNGRTSYKIKRFKGLGEMNPDQLKDTTMDPNLRNLIQVTIEDASLAEKRVSVLMGDHVEPRKEWINENVEFSLVDDFEI